MKGAIVNVQCRTVETAMIEARKEARKRGAIVVAVHPDGATVRVSPSVLMSFFCVERE